MRMLNPSLAVASLLGFLTAASCTLITDVDRTKIPTDAGPGSGGTGGDTGASGAGAGNEGGGDTGGRGGRGGNGGNGGTSGRGGNAGTAGTEAGAGGNEAGTGGSTTPTEACLHATGRITIGLGTQISTGWTFTIGDGVNSKVTFKFDWDDDSVTESGSNLIHFSGDPTPAEWAVLITNAINGAVKLDVTATTTASGSGNGAGGAGGEGGIGAGGASGGQAGAVEPPAPMTETVELTNDWAGSRGNVTITETVGNPNFKVTGLKGGSAVVCSATDVACDDNSECDAARTCGSDHVCE